MFFLFLCFQISQNKQQQQVGKYVHIIFNYIFIVSISL